MEQLIQQAITAYTNNQLVQFNTSMGKVISCIAVNKYSVTTFLKVINPIINKVIIVTPNAFDLLKYTATPPIDITAFVDELQEPITYFENVLEIDDRLLNEKDNGCYFNITAEPYAFAMLKRLKLPIAVGVVEDNLNDFLFINN